jgi:hypothetical protein
MTRIPVLLCLLVMPLAVSAQATSNPPPAAKLAGHLHYEMLPLQMVAPYAGKESNEKAKASIQQHLNEDVAPLLETWTKAAKADDAGTTVQIAPEIESVKFVSGGKRFWVGPLAGSSSVVLKVTLREEPAGTLIGEPEFYQQASAESGAWTLGGQDNDMLRRIVAVFKSYLEANYSEAVGGATGRPSK